MDALRDKPAPVRRTSYHPVRPSQKPLIDYCTNEWRNAPSYPPPHDPDFGRDEYMDNIELFLDTILSVIRAPKFRRLVMVVTLVTVASIVLWVKFLGKYVSEESALSSSIYINSDPASAGTFGANVRPQFPGIVHLKSLDPDLVPKASKGKKGRASHKKRLVFVGDIHGCVEELEALLKKVRFDPESDHLIATGDVVMKGPDSLGVIDLLRSHNASCVRGNHEDRLLLIAEDLHATSLRSSRHSLAEVDDPQRASPQPDEAEKELAMALSPEQLAWLKTCPVILRVGPLKPFRGEVVVVHAGLVPGLALEDQDPASVMNMRILDLATHVPSKMHQTEGSVPWFKLWNKYQRITPTQERLARVTGRRKPLPRQTVIYGHDAKMGLQINKYSKGLDTGCVRGGHLTALVVDNRGKEMIVQVPCRDRGQSSS